LTKEEGLIAWEAPAAAIHDQVRGLHPWPHAFTFLGDARVIVLRSAVGEPAVGTTQPGQVLAIEGDRVAVAAGDGRAVHLLQLQMEGRRPLSGRDFAAGARLKPGQRFGVWPL
jgi:methionyl-tRNA formyltransferase